ncbi:MAG TPA: hypothetical protein VFE46_12850, partial [Pirellulales bacterium]|nr:hypothetical protein [Pirellulales bacterium]
MPIEISIVTGSDVPIYRQIVDQICRVMGTMTGLATYLLLRLTREQTKTNAIRLLDRWQKLTNDAGATVTSS